MNAGLITFLRARLDEDERTARAAVRAVGDVPGGVPGAADWRFGDGSTDEAGTYWHITTTPPDSDLFSTVELVGSGSQGGGVHEPEIARHIARHDPARVLAEVEAKRQLVDAAEAFLHEHEGGADPMADAALRLLALPYATHPDYREVWRP